MKKILIGLIGATGGLALSGAFTACSDNFDPSADGEGKFLVSVSLDKDVVTSASEQNKVPSSRAQAQSITASDLSLKIESESGNFSREWAKASEFTDPVSAPIGSYTIEAWYGAIDEEGFDKPYYYGTSTLSVEENHVTPVSVSAQLANSMVRVEMSDMFRSYFASYTVSLRSELGNDIVYPEGETGSIYLKPGQITTSISITKQNGTTATLEPTHFTALPRHSYVLKFDVNSGEAGEGELVLTYDEMTETEDVIIDLSDALLNAPAPKLSANGFASGDSWQVVEGTGSAITPRMTADVQGGVGAIILTTSSEYLASKGVASEIDLVGGDVQQIALIKSLGLKVLGTTSSDIMAFLDFSELIKNLGYVSGGNNTSTFSVQVRDKTYRVTDPVSFSVAVTDLQLAIEQVNSLAPGATDFNFDISFNGETPTAATTKLEIKNDRNTWDECTINSIEPVAGKAGVYHINATIAGYADDFTMRLTLGTVQLTAVVTLSPSPYSLTAAGENVFATKATLNLSYDASATSRRGSRRTAVGTNVNIQMLDNSTWKTVASESAGENVFKVSGLPAGSKVTLRAKGDGFYSKPCTITTESAAQLPNSDMETWYRVSGSTKYWWIDYPGADANAVWGTLNQLTTSVGDGNTNMFFHKGCSYCAFSGTRPTGSGFEDRGIANGSANHEKAHTGSYAAVISTVGWGDNDGNGGTTVGKGCKNLTPGELYLGTYDASAKAASYTGMTFASRPSGLAFYYYYCVKNSADYGLVEVSVEDASGNVIASGSKNLSAAADYVLAEVPLEYAAGAAKAARIFVKFKSSGNSSCWAINNDNLSCPSFGNLTSGRFTGSELFVDDIVLKY